ncbi:MAG: hypothetical protein ROW48_03395 [Bellilinea sp.]|jgi:hypothetical protein
MLTLLPILFTFLVATLVFGLHWSEQGRRYAWLVSVGGMLLAWGGVLALRWLEPAPLVFTHWRPFDPSNADPVIFRWDSTGWVYAFGAVSLGLAVILTAPARFKYNSTPLSWAAVMIFTSVGLLAILSGSPVAMAVSWMILDTLEMMYVMLVIRDEQYRREALASFSLRVFGIFLLVAAIVLANQRLVNLTFENITSGELWLLIAAVTLRLGIFPINLNYEQQLPLQHGLTSLMRIVGQVTALALLVKLPAGMGLPDSQSALVMVAALIGIYSALMWLIAASEISGRAFLGLTFSCMAIISAGIGNSGLSSIWGIAILSWGGMLFLFSIRSRRLLILPLAGVISISGLPFTPLASGWAVASSSFSWILYLVIVRVILIAGYIRHALREGESSHTLEPYARTTYAIGLFILVASGWLAVALGIPGGLTLGFWWSGLLTLALCALAFRLIWQGKGEQSLSRSAIWLSQWFQSLSGVITSLLSLNWLYRILRTIFHVVQRVLGFFSTLFEGEGGVLWSILLLALLISLIGGAQ